jgi:quercetin dioxygenase-like cupin family protein
LKKDGVIENHLDEANKFCINLRDVFSKFDSKSSWSYRLVNTENNSATIISQMPGEGNRLHYHPSWNEWWLILDGEWKWEIEGAVKTVVKGDVVFIPAGKKHKITATGISPAVRLAVSRADVPHVYPGV